MNATCTRAHILWLREWYRIRHYFWGGILNTTIFWPITFAIGSGYIAPMCVFGRIDPKMATMMYAGMILLQLMVMAHTVGIVVMRERTSQHIIQYQASSTSLFLVYTVRYLFYSLWVTVRLLPFFPMSKLLLGDNLYTAELSWAWLILMVVLSSFLGVAYGCFLSSMLSSMTEAGSLWERYVEPMLWLGGVWVPWLAMVKALAWLGYISLVNPFLYVTEAVRSLFFTTQTFIPFAYCTAAIVCATGAFFFISYHIMRRRLDAV